MHCGAGGPVPPEVQRRTRRTCLRTRPPATPVVVARRVPWEHHLLVWDGEEAGATKPKCQRSSSSGTPLSDISRFQELTPQLVTGQTVGAGHFITLFVPEQVNAMIERFLVISLPAPA